MHRPSPSLRPLGAVLAATLAACGGVQADEPDASIADASVDAGDAGPDPVAIDASVDAAPPAARCNPRNNFGRPEKLAGLINHPTAADISPWLSADERRIYFSSDRDSGFQLYLATRNEPGDDFGDPVRIDGLGGTNTNPFLSADENTIYFDAVRGNAGTYQDVYVATRTAADQPFTVERVDGVAAAGAVYDGEPYLGATGERLYVTSARDPVADRLFGIFQANVVRNAFVIEPGASPLIADGSHPVLSPDERQIYFMRNGGTIWTATRGSATEPAFGAAAELEALDGPEANDLDAPGWISADGCAMYFVTDRGTPAQRDIWVSRKSL
jgi:hypothetical protein